VRNTDLREWMNRSKISGFKEIVFSSIILQVSDWHLLLVKTITCEHFSALSSSGRRRPVTMNSIC
jgi:hypothetical protein